jgi:hypothetical protein
MEAPQGTHPEPQALDGQGIQTDSANDVAGEEADGEGEDEEGEDEDEDESGPALLGDWWGLGGEATETAYVGLVELGVVVLVVGVAGYSAAKRTSVLPTRFRPRLLQAHEWSMLVGTALVAPHFVAVEEWEGLGLLVGILLAIEVTSGLYGRHLHRHVIRLGRGEETPPVAGRVLDVTKARLLSRWRRIHVQLTAVTAVVLVAHVLTALG